MSRDDMGGITDQGGVESEEETVVFLVCISWDRQCPLPVDGRLATEYTTLRGRLPVGSGLVVGDSDEDGTSTFDAAILLRGQLLTAADVKTAVGTDGRYVWYIPKKNETFEYLLSKWQSYVGRGGPGTRLGDWMDPQRGDAETWAMVKEEKAQTKFSPTVWVKVWTSVMKWYQGEDKDRDRILGEVMAEVSERVDGRLAALELCCLMRELGLHV
jgi:hypothetical protein